MEKGQKANLANFTNGMDKEAYQDLTKGWGKKQQSPRFKLKKKKTEAHYLL